MSKHAYIKPPKWTEESIELINHILEITSKYLSEDISVTVRQLFYQLVSKNIIENSEGKYKKIGRLVKEARMSGYLDWDTIADHVRIPNIPNQFENLNDLIRAASNSYRLDRWKDQEYYVELWCEKDALTSVLEPITQKYHIPLVTDRGYTSTTAVRESALRIKSKPHDCIILYLGDHDPSGIHMVRDINRRLGGFNCHPTIKRIALDVDQVKKFNLPPNPAKKSDPRSSFYIEQFGASSWEVDALPSPYLTNLVESEILTYLDIDKYNQIIEQERVDLEQLKNWSVSP